MQHETWKPQENKPANRDDPCQAPARREGGSRAKQDCLGTGQAGWEQTSVGSRKTELQCRAIVLGQRRSETQRLPCTQMDPQVLLRCRIGGCIAESTTILGPLQSRPCLLPNFASCHKREMEQGLVGKLYLEWERLGEKRSQGWPSMRQTELGAPSSILVESILPCLQNWLRVQIWSSKNAVVPTKHALQLVVV